MNNNQLVGGIYRISADTYNNSDKKIEINNSNKQIKIISELAEVIEEFNSSSYIKFENNEKDSKFLKKK